MKTHGYVYFSMYSLFVKTHGYFLHTHLMYCFIYHLFTFIITYKLSILQNVTNNHNMLQIKLGVVENLGMS